MTLRWHEAGPGCLPAAGNYQEYDSFVLFCMMPFHRNFTYWIDKRRWKYYFLMVSLQLDKWMHCG